MPRQEAIGRRCSDVFRATMCETECALRRTLQTGTAAVNKATFIISGRETHTHQRIYGIAARPARHGNWWR